MVSSMSWNLDLETFEAGDFLGWPQADNSEAHCLEDCVIHVSLLRCMLLLQERRGERERDWFCCIDQATLRGDYTCW